MKNRTFVVVMLLVVSPMKAVAGPPEGVSGKMVREGERIQTAAGLVIIRQGRGEMTVEGPNFSGTASRIKWEKDEGSVRFEGTKDKPVRFTQQLPRETAVVRAAVITFSPETGFFWAVGPCDVTLIPRRVKQLSR